MQTTRPCGHEMFDCVFPFKHHLYSYVSASVFQNIDGTLDDDLRNDLVAPALVGKLFGGREWFDLVLFTPLEGRLRRERGRAPRAGEYTSWPHGVFRDQAILLKVLCSARLATSGAVRLGFMAVWIIFWSTSTNTVTVPTTRLWSSTTFIKSSCALRWVRNAPLSSQTPRRPFQCSQSKQRRGMFVWPSCASQRSGALRTRRGEALLAQWRQLCHHRRRCGKSTWADSLTCSLTAQPAVFRTAPTARLRLKVLAVVRLIVHTFSSSPWDTLNGPTFVTRL